MDLPTKFERVIDLTVAQSLGAPSSRFARADEALK